MKFSVKQITTFAIALVITVMLFLIFVLFFESAKDDVSFIVDEANRCQWESGVVVSTTEMFNPNLYIEKVDGSLVDSFIAEAEDSGLCIAEVGDESGFYAPQLNKQYEGQ